MCRDAKRGVKWMRVACEEAVFGAGHRRSLELEGRSCGRVLPRVGGAGSEKVVSWLVKLERRANSRQTLRTKLCWFASAQRMSEFVALAVYREPGCLALGAVTRWKMKVVD